MMQKLRVTADPERNPRGSGKEKSAIADCKLLNFNG